MKLQNYIYGLLSAATYGLIPLFALTIMHKGVAVESLLTYRFGVTAILLALIMLFKKQSFKVNKKELAVLVCLGILFALSSLFLFNSYNYLSVGIASTVLYIYPVFTAIIMFIFFKEKVSWIVMLAIAIAFIGIFALYQGDQTSTISTLGILFVLGSALAYSIYMVVINKSCIKDMNSLKVTFYAVTFCTIVFFINSVAASKFTILPDAESVFNILMLAIVCTVISCITLAMSIHRIGSTPTAVLGALEPLVAVCVGLIAFNEDFTFNLALGFTLIIASVLLIILATPIQILIRKTKLTKIS